MISVCLPLFLHWQETGEAGMAEQERIVEEMEEEEEGDLPPGEDNDSDREEDERLFAWIVNDDMEEDEEEDEVEELEELEDEQPLLDAEASESFELDTPAERSGHIAVVDRNVMYVWGGYKVSIYVCP